MIKRSCLGVLVCSDSHRYKERVRLRSWLMWDSSLPACLWIKDQQRQLGPCL